MSICKTKNDCISSLFGIGKLYVIAEYIDVLKEKYNIKIDLDKTIVELNKMCFE